jgi:WD40 repeat protein/uncharacterized caspase-like protein
MTRIILLLALCGSFSSVSTIAQAPDPGNEIVAHVVYDNGKPVITKQRVAALDKGSDSGVTEGDVFTLRRFQPGKINPVTEGVVQAVLPTYSILLMPADLSEKDLSPSDAFVHTMPNGNAVAIASQAGHSAAIRSISFSPDDSLLASGSEDGVVKVWSVSDRRLLMTLKASIVAVVGLEFTADGKHLITATEEDHNNLKVWDLMSGHVITSLFGHNSRLDAIAMSPTEPLLASSSWDGTVKLWNLISNDLRCTCNVKLDSLEQGLTFSPDGKLVFAPTVGLIRATGTLSTFRKIRAWSTTDCSSSVDLDAAPRNPQDVDTVHSLTWFPTRNVLAAGNHNGTITMWNAPRLPVTGTASVKEPIYSLSASAKADLLAYGTNEGTVGLWNPDKGTTTVIKSGSGDDAVWATKISHDARLLAWGGNGSAISIYDFSLQRITSRMAGTPDEITDVIPLLDDRSVGTVYRAGALRLWRLDAGDAAPQEMENPPNSGKTCISRNGTALFVGHGRALLKPLLSGNKPLEIPIDKGGFFGASVLQCAVSEQGELFALGKTGGQVDIWDTRTKDKTTVGEDKGPLAGAGIDAIQFSPNGQQVAWTQIGGGALLDTRTFKVVKPLKQEGLDTVLSFSKQGDMLALSATLEPHMTLMSTGSDVSPPIQFGDQLEGNFGGTSFSPDGSTLAVAANNSIQLWDVKSRQLRKVLRGPSEQVRAIAYLNDGRILASAHSDSNVNLWSASSGELLCTLVPVGSSDWLVFTPEGFFDGTRSTWNLVPFHFASAPLRLYEPEQFFNEFFEPGVLAEITRSATSIKEVLQSRHDPRALLDISKYQDSHLPIVEIQHSPARSTDAGSVTTTIRATNTGSGIQDCRVFRNHSLVHFEHGTLLAGTGTSSFSVTIPLVPGRNEISSYCFNRDGLRSKEGLLVVDSAVPVRGHPRAYIVAVGVDSYSNSAYNLNFAGNDAEDMAGTLTTNLKALGQYDPISVVIRDDHATKAVILAALGRLGDNKYALPTEAPPDLIKLAAAKPQDIVLFFFAGHGMGRGDNYYLLPHDIGYQGPRDHLSSDDVITLQQHGVSDEDLQNGFEKIDAGLSMLVVDACESGKVLDSTDPRPGPMNSRGLAQLAYDKGMYVLTAAQSREAALEAGGKYGHGLLTYALAEEGLRTRLAYKPQQSGKLALRQWFDYAVARVPQLQAKLMQDAQGRNWTLAIIDGEEAISDPSKRSLQHPRVFYRREADPIGVFVANVPSEHH